MQIIERKILQFFGIRLTAIIIERKIFKFFGIRLNDTITTAVAECFFNFTERKNKFCLGLHYNRSNSFLFVDGENTLSI